MFRVVFWSCVCCFVSGCAFSVPFSLQTTCTLADSQPNRQRAVQIAASLSETNGMHDETERLRAHVSARKHPPGYTLIVAYADQGWVLPYRRALKVTSRQGGVLVSLYERRCWTKRPSARYPAIQEVLTNAFAGSFDHAAAATSSQ